MTASWWIEDGRRDEQRGRREELHLREGEYDEEDRVDQLWQDDVCEASVAQVKPIASAVSAAGSCSAVLGVADSNPTPPRRGWQEHLPDPGAGEQDAQPATPGKAWSSSW
eukprot:16203034-Heterocapsa_arctica.AAC.1